jgi:hypothetical protein
VHAVVAIGEVESMVCEIKTCAVDPQGFVESGPVGRARLIRNGARRS